MNTQDTKVHIRLWHRDFWFMALANLLLTMSVYCLLPVVPSWLSSSPRLFPAWQTGVAIGVFGLGVFSLGCFCSYFVQRYRRNHVCLLAIAASAACSAVMYYIEANRIPLPFASLVSLRFVHGACYGLAKMVLTSTLIIDTCESHQRTEANHSAAWFARFALSLGPLAGLLALSLYEAKGVFLMSAVCAALALLLVMAVSFPFRSPEDNVSVFSLDRFFLPQAAVLFVNLALVSTAVGLVLSVGQLTAHFFGFVMLGFLLALLAAKFVFANADLKSEAVSGLLFMAAAIMVILFPTRQSATLFAPTLFGLGVGVTSARFLLFFIKLSRHCKRGTSQSTYLLAWELGIAVGLALAFAVMQGETLPTLLTALASVTVALIMYVAFTHTWFIKHKNR